MKRIYILYIFVSICLFLSSCHTSQKITISGTPGTEIYSPNMNKLATVQSDGTTDIKISSDEYYAFLMSHVPNTQEFVPFALDYKNKSYSGTKFLKGLGITLTSAGVGAILIGGIVALADRESSIGGIIMAAGGGLSGIGASFGTPATYRLAQIQYKYQYKYLSQHSTNEYFTSVPIIDNGVDKVVFEPKKSTKARSNILGSESNDRIEISPLVVESESTASRHSFKDDAKRVAGSYSGQGKLQKDDKDIEQFDKITVVIDRIGRNKVEVNILENGEPFFDSKIKYDVKKDGDRYVLTLVGISSATIIINEDGTIEFNHPKVNIDDDIYTLKIEAKRQ